MKRWLRWLKHKSLRKVRFITEKIKLPGFKGNSLYDVGSFFAKGLINGMLDIRAGSVAYSLFIAIFPSLIFIFSLIPFIPIENFHNELFLILEDVLPSNAYSLFYDTISDIILNQRGSTLSLSLILMLIFSSNGVVALIDAFNASYHVVESRSWIGERLISILLVIIISFLLILAVALIVMGNGIFDAIVRHYPTWDTTFINILYVILKWLIVIALYFMAISFLYYLAPAKKSRFEFITPGAIMATVIQIIAVLGFSFYVNNFARYNKFYGSIGTIIVVMLLFYITALVLILGFELNISTNALTGTKEAGIKQIEESTGKEKGKIVKVED